MQEELVAWVKTLLSAAVYAILIVTFGFQVARVEGQSMAPTLEDQDRLIVNKLVYRIGEPRRGDIVMLYYPLNPDKSFVKRVIAEEGDTVRIVDGRVYVNDVPLHDDYVPERVPQPRRLGPAGDSRGLLLRDGRPPEQQLRQPPLGHGAEEVHHRQGAAALVAGADGARVLSWLATDVRLDAGQLVRAAQRRVPTSRYADVSRVLVRVLFLNLAVARREDRLRLRERRDQHPLRRLSLADRRRSNVVGLVGVRAARRPPDEDHPYGHRKYETVAAAAVTAFLLLVVLEVLRNAFNHLTGRSTPPEISTAGFVDHGRHRGDQPVRRPLRIARGAAAAAARCCWPTRCRRAATSGRRSPSSPRWPARAPGLPILDPLAALVVAGFIGYAGYQIATTTTTHPERSDRDVRKPTSSAW